MKKYITTDKHPVYKAGIIIEDYSTDFIEDKTGYCRISKLVIDSSISLGYIKEVQEPAWTDDDMIEFRYFRHGLSWCRSQTTKEYHKRIFLKFKKEKGK